MGICDKRTLGSFRSDWFIVSFSRVSAGTSGGSLIHVLWNEFGPEVAKRLLNEVQAVVNCWLLSQGFSVGIGDTIADSVTLEDITRTIKVQLTAPYCIRTMAVLLRLQ